LVAVMLVGCNGTPDLGMRHITEPPEDCGEPGLSWTWPADGATDVPYDAIVRMGLEVMCDEPYLLTLEMTDSGTVVPTSAGSWSNDTVGVVLEVLEGLEMNTAYTLTFEADEVDPIVVQFATGDSLAPPPPDHTVDLEVEGICRLYGDGVREYEWISTGVIEVDGDRDGLLVGASGTGDDYVHWGEIDEGIELWAYGNPDWFGEMCSTTTIRAVNGVEGAVVETCAPMPTVDPDDCVIMD
jgi:hypothetical protein